MGATTLNLASMDGPAKVLILTIVVALAVQMISADDCLLCGVNCPQQCFDDYVAYTGNGDVASIASCQTWRDTAPSNAFAKGKKVIDVARDHRRADTCGADGCMKTAFDELAGAGASSYGKCAAPGEPAEVAAVEEAKLLEDANAKTGIAAKTDDLIALMETADNAKAKSKAGWTCW